MLKKMNLSVVEDFLKNNPDFHVYVSNPIKRRFEKVIIVNGNCDFETLENPYIINSTEERISLTSLKGTEIYKLVNE